MPSHSMPAFQRLLKAVRDGAVRREHLISFQSRRDAGGGKGLGPKLHEAVAELREVLEQSGTDFREPIDPASLRDGIIRVLVNQGSLGDHEAVAEELLSFFRRDQRTSDFLFLRGAAARPTERPWVQRLGSAGWIVVPGLPHPTAAVLHELVGDAPDDLGARLDRARKYAEDGIPIEDSILLFSPFVVFRADRGGAATRFIERLISVIALRNLVVVNRLHPLMEWDLRNLGFCGGQGSGPNWSDELRDEWCSLLPTSPSLHPRIDVSMPHPHVGGEPFEAPPLCDHFSGFQPVIDVSYNSKWLLPRFPIVVLPSLFREEEVTTLVEVARDLDRAGLGHLTDRLGHALTMWGEAWRYMSDTTLDFFEHPDDGTWVLAEPDLATMYTAIVLEGLFSEKTDAGMVTQRIADRAAALIGRSGDERFQIAQQAKRFYAARSDFVHGRRVRPSGHDDITVWGFLLATCALWESINIAIVEDRYKSEQDDWRAFDRDLERRKYGS